MTALATPTVTVIIPAYNHAAYIAASIESALNQTHPPDEIIVVDDGSGDNTREICAQYPQVRYLWQQNRGVCVARNRGLQESRGEFVVFLDDDDTLLPHAVEIGLTQLLSRPEYAFTSGWFNVIGPDGETLPDQRRGPLPEGDAHLALLRGEGIAPPIAFMFRRTALVTVRGFDQSVACAEDYDLALRLAARFPVHYHSERVANYRWHGNNASHRSRLMLRAAIAVLRRQRDVVVNDPEKLKACIGTTKKAREYYSEKLLDDVSRSLQAGRTLDLFRNLGAFARYNPAWFVKRVGRAVARRLSTSAYA